MGASEKAARRYAALVEQLADELGRKWGWQTAVAKRLGITQVYVSQIHNGERTGVGASAIEKAVRRIPLDPSYFYGPHHGTPHYSTFVPGSRAVDTPAYPALLEFLAGPEGRGITPDEEAFLRGYRASHGEPTPLTFHFVLMAYRSELTPAEAAESAELTEASLRRAKARGGVPLGSADSDDD